MNIPMYTVDFIKYLETIYIDELELDDSFVGSSDYWKKAGVVELLRKIKFNIDKNRLINKEI